MSGREWLTPASPLEVNTHSTGNVCSTCSIGKGTGYKASELASLDEGHTLVIGGKEIEVRPTQTMATSPLHTMHLSGPVAATLYKNTYMCGP